MCGILGSVNFGFCREHLDLIRSRGPDDSDIKKYIVGPNQVNLGHRRLSIVELSVAGHQPMDSSEGAHSICYNGEVYNHLALRDTLKEIDFVGQSDTETVLHHLIRNNVEGVKNLNGIFSFAYLDKHKKKLYLVRDPYGTKPLYYKVIENKLIFSSEIKPIVALSPDNVSVQNISELLTLRYSPSPSTLFQNIKKVRPGHYIVVDLAKEKIDIKEISYVEARNVYTNLNFSEALEEYERLFEASVERQLMSDVDIGVFLSGGVDSALVAKVAANRSDERLKAYTVGFEGGELQDETDDARVSASVIGLDYHQVKIGFDEFISTLNKCVEIVEEPTATTSIVPMYYLSELASKDVKVVLSGQGADEPLGGYRRYKGELIHQRIPSFIRMIMCGLVDSVGIKNDTLLRGAKSLSAADDVDRFLETYRVFSNESIKALIGEVNNSARHKIDYFYNELNCSDLNTSVERMMSIDCRMNLSDDLLLYTDKITMHHSLECRVPMLDHELIKFIESLPYEYRLRLGGGKLIHKAYAKRVLPDKLVNRKKKGFQSPTNKWFSNKEAMKSILLKRGTLFSEIFNIQEVEKLLDQHVAGFNRERHIFLLLSIYSWIESYC